MGSVYFAPGLSGRNLYEIEGGQDAVLAGVLNRQGNRIAVAVKFEQ